MTKRNNRNNQSGRSLKTGLSPGSVVYTGTKNDRPLNIEIIKYGVESFEEFSTTDINDCLVKTNPKTVTWINVNGLNHVEEIKQLGSHFGISLLVLEELVNPSQRSKLVEAENYTQVTMKIVYYDKERNLKIEHLSFVLFNQLLISFTESDNDQMESVRSRLRSGIGRIRSLGAGYLLFALMDNVVDHYFYLTETLTDKLEVIEDEIFESYNSQEITGEIQKLKKEVIRIKRAINPIHEITSRMGRVDNTLIQPKIQEFYKDLHDHILQVLESVESNREMIWGLMDIHMNYLSFRMNEVMKVLTIVSTIFIPLAFIAGVYGMNFEYMPELGFKHSYFILLGFMLTIIILMIFFFKRKKWI